ncbi:DNA polymerase III subunit delta [Candidatus Parcubacteria bacterium]|nr:DNA polymerase III subunit delta [Candidatus Parcubacteria bacterium]
MLIFVYGDDTFRVAEKVRELTRAFREKFDKTGMNIAVFPSGDGGALSAPEVLQAACSYPFLGPRRMVVVRGLMESVNKKDEAVWVDGFSRMPETTIAVLSETAAPGTIEKKAMFKRLSEMAEIHTYVFAHLAGEALSRWTQERVRAKGGTIEPLALRALVERVGSDLWRMDGEIGKLVAYAQDSLVTKAMVEALVSASFESRIFELMDALSKKQTKRALELLEQERLSGSDDHYLLTMLGRQVRILLAARAFVEEGSGSQADFSREMSLHPYPAGKALEQSRAFSLADLKHAHELLFEYDVNIKTGRMGAGLAVDLMTERLIRF